MTKEDFIPGFIGVNRRKSADEAALCLYFASVSRYVDTIKFFDTADPERWSRLLCLMRDEKKETGSAFELNKIEWRNFVLGLSSREISVLVNQMQSDDAADFLGKLPLSAMLASLRYMRSFDRIELQRLLRYPEDSAGGIMQVELAQISVDATVSDAIKTVRSLVEDDIEILSVWVVDDQKRLIGSLLLVELLLNKETTKVKEIMEKNIAKVTPLVDQEEVASVFKKYDLMVLPVVDGDGKLLGKIVVDDVVDVLSEEAEEDAMRMGGTSSEEMLYRDEIFSTARIRLPWLSVALLCSLVSSVMLRFFEYELKRAVVLTFCLPVLTAMEGNVGTQSATILIRGFATGRIDLSCFPRILFKELCVGFLMGVIYGACAASVAVFALTDCNFYFGLVVFISMLVGMMIAAAMGVLVPSLLKWINIDPAIAAGPFVTTLNDITGILVYMTVAMLFISNIS